MEADTGQILYREAENRRFIPASITKIMTAYVAFDLLKHGDLDVDQRFAMSEEIAKDWYRKGSTMFLEPGELVKVGDLLRGITSVSANDASVVLAVGVDGSIAGWTARMNRTASTLGLRDSHFATPNGWPDNGRTFTTAADLAILARALTRTHPVLYREYFGTKGMRYNGFAQANHDPITGVVDGADGIKTGFTRQAGYGFVGSAMRDGRRLILVVAGIDRAEVRTTVSRDLMEWGFDAFERDLVFTKGQVVGSALVQDGASDRVDMTVPQDFSLTRAARGRRVDATVRYIGPLQAPIGKGAVIARLDIANDDGSVASIPLVAADNVAEAGMLRRIVNAIESWVS